MIGFNEIIQRSVVCLNLKETDGMDVISHLVQEAVKQGALRPEDEEVAIRAIMNREQSAPTAQTDGIAIPHGRISCITEVVFMLGIHPEGVDFGAPDGAPTHLFAQMLAPQSCGAGYIQFLAQLCQRLLDEAIRVQLLHATSKEEVCNALLKNGGASEKRV